MLPLFRYAGSVFCVQGAENPDSYAYRRMEFEAMSKYSEKVTQDFLNRLQTQFNVTPDEASDKQIYLALSAVICELLRDKRQKFMNHVSDGAFSQDQPL